MSIRIEPADYLDLDGLEMYGPGQHPTQPQQQAAPVAAPPVQQQQQTSNGDEHIFALQRQLFEAQRNGDHARLGVLQVQMDEALQGLTGPSQEAPNAGQPQQQQQQPSEDDPVDQQKLDQKYAESQVRQDLINKYSAEEVQRVHDFANQTLSEDEVMDYIELLYNDSPEAIMAFDSLKQMADNPAIAPEAAVEYTAFDQGQASELEARFGDLGREMVILNQQFLSGQITRADMQRHVLSDPALTMACFQAKAAGLITY